MFTGVNKGYYLLMWEKRLKCLHSIGFLDLEDVINVLKMLIFSLSKELSHFITKYNNKANAKRKLYLKTS